VISISDLLGSIECLFDAGEEPGDACGTRGASERGPARDAQAGKRRGTAGGSLQLRVSELAAILSGGSRRDLLANVLGEALAVLLVPPGLEDDVLATWARGKAMSTRTRRPGRSSR
jgi:hypothetical protein